MCALLYLIYPQPYDDREKDAYNVKRVYNINNYVKPQATSRFNHVMVSLHNIRRQ